MEPSFDFKELFTVASLVSLLTLALLEIVLGIDNIIFVSIATDKLPKAKQKKARSLGLSLALVLRIFLLLSIAWIIGLTKPLFYVSDNFPFFSLNAATDVAFTYACSFRDLILIAGGIFLLFSSTREIHKKIEGVEEAREDAHSAKSFRSVIFKIMLIDVIFSFDSILTAVGLVSNVLVMIIAVIIAMIVMMSFSGVVSRFVNDHPTVKMLALAFLIMIGMVLIADGLHFHVPKGYVYFSVAFSLGVEVLNLRMKRKQEKRQAQ
jgi:predicted tellurium resistance membrane protein TerC